MLPVFLVLLAAGALVLGKVANKPGADVVGFLPAATGGTPLAPEEERLIMLLVLYQKDQGFPAGSKKYLTRDMAHEAVRLARQMRLLQTIRAMLDDRPLPSTERFPGREFSVAMATVLHSRTGKI